jgi:putative two-component system response regulator
VVDVFDALVSKRRYKPPIPLDLSLKFMSNNAGTEFDPDIIRVFMKIYRNFKGIGNEN